jgi:predicted pyridoxine 5'-phosphate oxidase superfamily flavin-nucleotide-binding protein
VTHRYAQIAFTDAVRRHQSEHGSRHGYSRMEQGPPEPDALGPGECAFVASRDSFYLASVSDTGWPYVQHRGGQPGFLRVRDPRTLVFPDYRGNRQYISLGNLDHNDRVALLLMDYPMRARLKIFGRARALDAPEAEGGSRGAAGSVERLIEITVHAFDWNCQQYIQPRYTADEITGLHAQVRMLERENRALRARLATPDGTPATGG